MFTAPDKKQCPEALPSPGNGAGQCRACRGGKEAEVFNLVRTMGANSSFVVKGLTFQQLHGSTRNAPVEGWW